MKHEYIEVWRKAARSFLDLYDPERGEIDCGEARNALVASGMLEWNRGIDCYVVSEAAEAAKHEVKLQDFPTGRRRVDVTTFLRAARGLGETFTIPDLARAVGYAQQHTTRRVKALVRAGVIECVERGGTGRGKRSVYRIVSKEKTS